MNPLQQESDYSLMADIDKCLEEERLDKRFMKFIFVYEQIPESIKNEKVGELLKDLYAVCINHLKDKSFRNKLTLLHQVVTDGAGTILFDEKHTDSDKYDTDFYDDVLTLRNDLDFKFANALGLVKAKLKEKKGINMKEGW